MPVGLEDLTEQSYLYGESDLPLLFGPIRENDLLMAGARRNWSLSEWNDSDELHTCARRSRCMG